MKKYKSILILVFCSLVPLLFTSTIPFALPTRLHVNSLLMSEHIMNKGLYVITLEEGSQYTIVVDSDNFWGMDLSLRIGETPYMINGLSVESSSYEGERMHFTALKTGDYYIQVKAISGSGFYDIWVDSGTSGSATGSNTEFFDVSYLLVLLLPTIFILAVGILIMRKRATRRKQRPERISERRPFINKYKRVKTEEKELSVDNKDVMICEHCGVEINKGLKKCPNCQTSLK